MTWRPRQPSASWIVVLVLLVGAMGACGDADEPEAQPAEEPVLFVEGDVGEVPVHPLAEPVGNRTEENDVIAQSFRVRNVTREQLFDWYEDNLRGWRLAEAPGPVGSSSDAAWRGRWERDDRRLLVTVSDAPTLEPTPGADDSNVLQMSLSLEPASRPLPEG